MIGEIKMEENKLTLNVDTIVSVKLRDEVFLKWWVWKSKTIKEWSWRKFKYIKIYKEGFYDSWNRDCYYTEKQLRQIEDNIIIDGEEVYRKANVIITTLGKNTITRYFRNFNEALNFYNTINKKIPNKIEI
jgi:hypothetical protein